MTAIKGNEIVEDGALNDINKGVKELNTGLKATVSLFGELAKESAKVAKETPLTDFRNIQKVSKAIKENEVATQALIKTKSALAKLESDRERAAQQKLKTDQQEIKVSQEKARKEQQVSKAIQETTKQTILDERAKQAKIRTTTTEAKETERLAKIERKQARELNALTNAYTQLTNKTNKAQAEFKRLAAAHGVNSKEARKAQKTFDRLDKKLRRVNDAARDGRRDVGRYEKAFRGLGGALRRTAGALGLIGGIALIGRGIRNTVNIFKDFEQAGANLAAVLGTSRSEITALTEDAKRLGSSTKFTAQQITGLQTEFAKLGFKEKEILDATEATLDLAAATGSDLAESAAIAGATLGGFGLEAVETQRVVDVMAKSFSTSALDMTKFQESMKTAAPAARALGINVEKTTALLGTLANAGISGSKAGNNLKTSFINLNKAGLTLEQGLARVAASTDKLGTATELVGKNAAASFLVLAEGVETTKELEEGLNEAGGAAKTMADEQLDTLSGATSKLSSAWEGFILSLEDGDGVIAQVLRGAIELATEFLEVLTNIGKSQGQLNKEAILGQREESKLLSQKVNINERLLAFQKESDQTLKDIIKTEEKGFLIAKKVLEQRTLGTEDLKAQIIIADELGQTLRASSREALGADNERLAVHDKLIRAKEAEIANEATLLELAKNHISAGELSKKATELELLQEERMAILKDAAASSGEAEAFQEFKLQQLRKLSLEDLEAITKLTERRKQDLVREAKAELQRRKDINEVEIEGLDIGRSKAEQEEETNKKQKERFDRLKTELEIEKERLETIEDIRDTADDLFGTFTIDADIMPVSDQALQDYQDLLGDVEEANEDAGQSFEDLAATATLALESLNNIVQAKAQERVDFLDREIEASRNHQEVLRTIAHEDVADAEDNLAFEQQKQAELEAEKQRQIERAAQLELVLSAVQTFNNEVQQGATAGEAISSTAVAMASLEALVRGLDFFYDGTDDTGNANGLGVDGIGGRPAIIHPNEQIWSKADRSDVGFRTRDEVKDIVHDWESMNNSAATLEGNNRMNHAIQVHRFASNAEVLRKFDNLEAQLESLNNKPVYLGRDFDKTAGAVVESIRIGNSLIRNHKKLGIDGNA